MAAGSGGLQAQSCPAPAQDHVFNVALCVDGQVASVGANSIAEIYDTVDSNRLRSQFRGYDENVTAGEFRVDLRGLPITMGYAQNSTELYFRVPRLGISETFNGGTRDASNEMLREYLRQNESRILRELVQVSPLDPLAGNPASLQSQMAASDYEAGFDPMVDGAAPGSSFGLGARFGTYSFGGINQNVYSLPISYNYTFSNHDVLNIRMPLTYIEAEGASAYQGMLGIGYKKIVGSRWALMPALGYGLTGSSDLGSRGQILSASLTSDLSLYSNSRWSLSMGNLLGYYLTMPTRVEDRDVDYDLENTVSRNGLLLSVPLQQRYWDRELSVDFFVTGTWYFGDELYSDNYEEVGVSIGPRRSADKREPNLASHPFGIGLKYIRGRGDISGVELNFGYRF